MMARAAPALMAGRAMGTATRQKPCQGVWPRMREASISPLPWAMKEASRILGQTDRKSTRLNSSHVKNSYAVFCLKKKHSRQAHSHHGGRCHHVHLQEH